MNPIEPGYVWAGALQLRGPKILQDSALGLRISRYTGLISR